MASTVLLFKNIFFTARKEENDWISQATLYLASALKRAGIRVLLSSLKFTDNREDWNRYLKELVAHFQAHPRINMVGISLLEDFFDRAEELIRFIRKRSDAFIGVGCVMPTLAPRHVWVHLPLVNFLVRGAGEEILPRLARILDGLTVRSLLDEEKKREIGKLPGLAFRAGQFAASSFLDIVNEPENFDSSVLDFSFLEKENLTEGLNLFTSRGCHNSCFFCTSPGRGRFTAKSVSGLKKILSRYGKRIRELYPEGPPPYALKVSFNDDDFLADPKRACSFFRFLKKTPYRVNFFQTGINSFFKREKNRYTGKLNRELIRSLSPDLFSGNGRDIYIGTENFCDRELSRLGKGYDRARVEKAIMALGERGIAQVHHFIVSNHLTGPADIIENLFWIAVFRLRLGQSFRILTPVIPYLVSLFPSASYKTALAEKRTRYLDVRRVLRARGCPEYDYPLVDHDIPVNRITRELVPFLSGLFQRNTDYIQILDQTLLYLLLAGERLKKNGEGPGKLLERFADYPSLLREKSGSFPVPSCCRLELILTRRSYSAGTEGIKIGRGTDMSAEVLFRSLDLLFKSSRDRVILEFSGSEPLLRMDLVKSAVRYARSLSLKTKKSVAFSMTTGLSLLTERIADYLRDEGFFLLLKPGDDLRHGREKIFSHNADHSALLIADPHNPGNLSRDLLFFFRWGFTNVIIQIKPGVFLGNGPNKILIRELSRIEKKYGPAIKKGAIRLEVRNSFSYGITTDVNGEIRFMSDALLDKNGKNPMPPLARAETAGELSCFPVPSPFCCLYRLLRYAPSPYFKKVIIDYIRINELVQGIFKKQAGLAAGPV